MPDLWEPPDSIRFDSDIVATESDGALLRVRTTSGRVYTIYRFPDGRLAEQKEFFE